MRTGGTELAWRRRVACVIAGTMLVACAGPSPGPGEATVGFEPGRVVEPVGATSPVPPGECRTVAQSAWVTAVRTVQVYASEDMGPNQGALACEVALQSLRWRAEQKCAVQFSSPGFYRNPVLLSVDAARGACRCVETNSGTRCEVEGPALCGYEVLETRPVEICG